MFSKESTQKPKVVERNILAKTAKIVGDLKSEGDFRIDGVFEGSITTTGRVVIGVDGSVEGTVCCENADIEGCFKGDLKVNNTLSIKSSASIYGEVVLGKLAVEPGATFNASCAMKGAVKELNSNETTTAEGKTA